MRAIIILILTIMLTSPALGQRVCSERKYAIEYLFKKFGETRIAGGVTKNGSLIEVFTNDKTGTYSVTLTIEFTKQLCIIWSGYDWMERNAPTPPDNEFKL